MHDFLPLAVLTFATNTYKKKRLIEKYEVKSILDPKRVLSTISKGYTGTHKRSGWLKRLAHQLYKA